MRQSGSFACLATTVLLVAALALPASAASRSHGLSTFGDLKYAADFKHFDYVNPDAPKGGRLTTIGTQASLTFDSFNPYILRGDAAQGFELTYDSLMTRALDEPDAVYGLVADWAEVADDRHAVTFHIRPEAKWADGTPITAADCAFTIDILKTKGTPDYGEIFRDVAGTDILDPQTIRYRFKGDNVRDLPLLIATLPVLSKAYYASRTFDEPSLDIPLTSGPYRISKYEPKSYVVYERRADYWGKDLAVNVGRFNFGTVKFDYYKDRTAGLEAFFAGDIDLREEFSSRDWATRYDSAKPVVAGRIVREAPPDGSPSGMQGMFLNLRRAKFQDLRTRIALDIAFDFEWSRKNLFYGQYKRVASYFENSSLKAEGKPSPEELKLLEPFRGKVPDEVFGEAPVPNVTDGSGQDRNALHKAKDLLAAAGWTIKDGKLVDAKGERFTLEFLLDDSSFERVIGPYIKNLQILGIDAKIRTVDPAAYLERQKKFDYDVVSARFVGRNTPGIELRNLFGTAAADAPASNNLGGIKDPAVDALIELVAGAKSRAELETAAHALDRVLRAGHYWVPEWFNDAFRLAYWNRFAKPVVKPRYDRGVIETWWYDAAKDAKLAGQ
jgi:microcin C transport system substrate-binding protein